ncbi:MAG: hypothetical protein AAF371_13895 [Pseudomonadota bacterium]
MARQAERIDTTLVTGFEPFGRWSVNSSAQGVAALAARYPALRTACLPVDHGRAAERLEALCLQHRPRRLLLAGLAPDAQPRLEAFGRPGPLAPHAAGVRRARWPLAAARTALAEAGMPARLSADAGRYVCDTTYWHALGLPIPAVLFLHLPPPGPSWPPHRLARAIAVALSVVR